MEEDIDRFLYGEESIQLQQPSAQSLTLKTTTENNDKDEIERNDNLEDDDEDDEFDVIIDGTNPDLSIKKQINLQNVQQPSSLSTSAITSASNVPKLDLNTIPQLNGQSIYDVDLDSFEEKPWKKPGADINDYFNYGFNESTWKIYCQKQQQQRQENKKINVLEESNLTSISSNSMMIPPLPILPPGFKHPPSLMGMGMPPIPLPPPGMGGSNWVPPPGFFMPPPPLSMMPQSANVMTTSASSSSSLLRRRSRSRSPSGRGSSGAGNESSFYHHHRSRRSRGDDRGDNNMSNISEFKELDKRGDRDRYHHRHHYRSRSRSRSRESYKRKRN